MEGIDTEYFSQTVLKIPSLKSWPECVAELTGSLAATPETDIFWSLLGTEAAGGDPKAAVPVSVAWNVLHLGIVILDDVLDREVLPPGSTYEERAALSSGPIFSAMQYVHLIGDPAAEARVATELFKAFYDCAHGQYLDAIQDRANLSPEEALQHYWKATILKSGSVYRAGLAAGAALATTDQKVIDALGAFGQAYGVIKQIYDDCQDVLEDLTKPKTELTLPILLYRSAENREIPTNRTQLVNSLKKAHVPETIGDVLGEWRKRAFQSIAEMDESSALEKLRNQVEDLIFPEITRL